MYHYLYVLPRNITKLKNHIVPYQSFKNSNLRNKLLMLLKNQQFKVELQDTSYETNSAITDYKLHKVHKMQ